MNSNAAPWVFFFVGHFNDIDHMAPVAYKMAQLGRGRPLFLVIDPLYDIKEDYRLQLLAEKYGIPAVSVLSFHCRTFLVSWISSLLRLPLGKGFLHRWRLRAIRATRRIFYGERWAGKILDRYHPAALAIESSQRPGGIPGRFLVAGHQRDIPSISFPNGVYIFNSEFISSQEKTAGLANRDYINKFDRVIYPTRHHAQRLIEEGVLPGNIAVLGSARYCPEWWRINLEVQPEIFTARKGAGCTFRLVFMLPHWNYNVDFEANMKTLHRLSAEPWLHIVVKLHTRETEDLPRYLEEFDAMPNVEIETKAGSVPLIQWTDAMMVLASSIAFEALAQGKPVVYPKYHHENSIVFENTGTVWQVNDDDQLVSALKSLSEGHPTPYKIDKASETAKRIALDGHPEKEVLEGYVDFLLGGWRNYPTYDVSSLQNQMLTSSKITVDPD